MLALSVAAAATQGVVTQAEARVTTARRLRARPVETGATCSCLRAVLPLSGSFVSPPNPLPSRRMPRREHRRIGVPP